MDATTIAAHLERRILPSGVRREDIEQEIRDTAASARRLMVINGCGGLPGPVLESPTLMRKILNLLGGSPNA